MRPDYESSVIDRGRGMGWATALGARSSGKNTDNYTLAYTSHLYKIRNEDTR